jgi:hypothetical protein
MRISIPVIDLRMYEWTQFKWSFILKNSVINRPENNCWTIVEFSTFDVLVRSVRGHWERLSMDKGNRRLSMF